MVSIEAWRLGHWIPIRQFKLYAPDGSEPSMDGFAEIPGLRRGTDSLPQDLPHFLFHGTAMLGRTDAQALLETIVYVADRDAGHETFPFMMQRNQ